MDTLEREEMDMKRSMVFKGMVRELRKEAYRILEMAWSCSV